MGPEYAFVIGMGLLLLAGALGFSACWPRVTLERERASRAEERAASAEAAVDVLAQAARERRHGAQADADHDAALREAMAGAPPGDPLAAAAAVVRVARAREAARAAAADPGGRPAGELGPGGLVAGGGPVGPDRPGARA